MFLQTLSFLTVLYFEDKVPEENTHKSKTTKAFLSLGWNLQFTSADFKLNWTYGKYTVLAALVDVHNGASQY